jgi:hypothetical protein
MPYFSVPFTNQFQEEAEWCWAATAANVFNAIKPRSAANLTPCDVVTRVVFDFPPLPAAPPPTPDPPNPCTDPESYNQTGFLGDALDSLSITDNIQKAPRIKDLSDELSGALDLRTEPVCAEVDFPDGATHFVAVSAVDTDNDHVWIEDPELGPGHTLEFTFSEFIGNYGYSTPPAPSGGTVPGFQKAKVQF